MSALVVLNQTAESRGLLNLECGLIEAEADLAKEGACLVKADGGLVPSASVVWTLSMWSKLERAFSLPEMCNSVRAHAPDRGGDLRCHKGIRVYWRKRTHMSMGKVKTSSEKHTFRIDHKESNPSH